MKGIHAIVSDEQKEKINAVSKDRDVSVTKMIRQWINGLKLKGDK